MLYGKLRPYLAKIARPTFAGVCSTDILPIKPGPLLDRDYLSHFLRQPGMVDFANSRATGANLPRLSPRVLASFEILLPPLPEQRRIAAILDQADTLRTQRRAALAQLDSLTRSLFLDMFGDPVTNPKGWPRFKLGDLVATGPQNGLYKPSTDYGSGTPILRIDAFYDGVVTKLNSLKRVRVSPEEATLFGLACDDIVINRVNSIEYLGKSAIIPPLPEPTVFESNMMRFSVQRDRVDPGFVVQFLQTPYVKAQILSGSKNAVNQSSINQQDVKGFLINVPPLPLQQTFATRVQAIEALKVQHRAALAELNALFASLQQRAFAGTL
ncbi:restriction endonuclease subunit S [Hydrogenophaga sp. SL48]|uniref:restriction endonuclease subunit S n=1 Tax=Hydrogenophaga sp. SL48 TaxID=2806347 RepID=UPI001F000E25|nr:restriction endonuclease subunit S [Hydrogenophaga sp. SL48]UJW79884.1 restriction endonuclease subunit S [Hydrogenophaga sp. SL48]